MSAVAPPAHAQSPLAGIRNVFVIVMENHNWSTVQGSTAAPYINGTLLPMASRAQAYYNPAGVHPSLPNYLWMEAGTSFGIQDDGDPFVNAQDTPDHLVTQLGAAGIAWKTYQEGISGTHCPLFDAWPYTPRHNPFIYFTDVTEGNEAFSQKCIRHVRPYAELATDLAAGTVPRYAFVTPNLCNDGHDTCDGRGKVGQMDGWLQVNLPIIMNSEAYRAGGAIFITWDEGASRSDGPIGMIVLSPFAKGYGYSNSIQYDHGSFLRTLQEIFGVRPFLREAARRTSLTDLFQPVATPPPACTLEAVPPSTPPGGSIVLTARCEPAATSYAWKPAAGLVAGASNTATVVPAGAGIFQYGVTGMNGSGTGNPAITSVVVTAATTRASVVEFYNAGLDHYFMTISPQEISDLDNRVHVGWTRTGLGFGAYSAPAPGANPVCRFYVPPAQGDSHFYSASPTECAQVETKFPKFILEASNSVYVGLPDVTTGACLTGWTPVYRVWNNRADNNHRYMTDRALRDQMVRSGWIAEGYGADSVIMCSPP